MECLVLGGAGFLGSHLSEALLTEGHNVKIFQRPNAKLDRLKDLPSLSGVEWIEGDFLNQVDIENALNGCDIVYHLISTTLPKSSNDAPIYDVETNLIGTLQLLNLICKKNIKKIIFISSGGTVYGLAKKVPIEESHPTEPNCAYGINKLAIEKYLAMYHALYGLEYSILRLANPYGERQCVTSAQGVITTFLHKVLNNETIEIWGDGKVIRDYIYVSDVIDALLKVKSLTSPTRVFNIGSGQGKSINDLIDAIENLVGKKLSCKYLAKRSFDVPENVLDISNAIQCLKWQPKVSFSQGLERTWEWIQNNYHRS
jgi:UDP-glucose 4-epimerase